MGQRRNAVRPVFTPLQGQYLAFIHPYELVNERAPTRHKMIQFFRVILPSVRCMVFTQEQASLILRWPETPGYIIVLLHEHQLPRLRPGFVQTVKTSVAKY